HGYDETRSERTLSSTFHSKVDAGFLRRWALRDLPIHLICGTDQPEMCECLREVPEVLALRPEFLGVEPEMIRVPHHLLKHEPRLRQIARSCKALDQPERTH